MSDETTLKSQGLVALQPPPDLLDAGKAAKEQPGHFSCPAEDQLRELKWGDWVEICLDREFIWCEVENVLDDQLEVYMYQVDEETGEYEGISCWFRIEKRHVFRVITNEAWLY